MIAVAILLLTFSSAANKAIADLGQVKIDDLFYNSDVPSINGEIKKFGLDQVDKILVKNEDLELESLEIADIDLATFGEYEDFLNKYYDDYHSNIDSKILKSVNIVTGGALATKIPFGQNAKSKMENGFKLGFVFKDIYTFNIGKIPSTLNCEFSFSSNKHKAYSDESWNFIHLNSIIESTLYNNILSEFGFGGIAAKYSNSRTSIGCSLFFGVNYKINVINDFAINLYGRAIIEKVLDELPLYAPDATVEQLQFGVSASLPVYITY